MTAPAAPFDFGIGFKPFADRVKTERADRLTRAPNILSFGVKFLDVALGGIFANDLVLLGAALGRGKTELATLIAMANAKAGKRVHYLALEAEENEIERRIKYKLLVSLVAGSPMGYRQLHRFNPLDWYAGKLEDVAGPLDADMSRLLARDYATLKTFYRVREFTGTQMERLLLAIQDETDLVILDHLHYVDSEDKDENRGVKAIVKKLRDAALDIGKPVILVAHVRKSDRKAKQLIPTEEDFHGSSDVPKIATKAIMLAPARDQPQSAPWRSPTYIHPVKCRVDGQRTRYPALVDFDARASQYVDDFALGRLTPGGDKFELLKPGEYPAWSKLEEKPEPRVPGEDDA